MPAAPRLLDGLTAAMRHLGVKQKVIAGNIANSETPGYKAQTVVTPDFAGLVAGPAGRITKPKVTLTSGMAALGAQVSASSDIRADRDTSETKPDGNNVTLEDQLLALGQVQADYATMTSMYRKHMGLLRTAIGKNGH